MAKGAPKVLKAEEKTESTPPDDVEEKKKNLKKEKEESTMSDEDKQLKEELEMLVERLKESDQKLYRPALESLCKLIKSSTTSMTSVPKPLKFLRPYYEDMKGVLEKIKDKETKLFCADIISVLGMTMSDVKDCLKYKLLGSNESIGSWGHEYVRHLQVEVAVTWQELVDDTPESVEMKDKLLKLVHEIVPYHLQHNAESEACDLLMEIERLDLLEQYVTSSSVSRLCLYLSSVVPYVPEPENTTLLKTSLTLYRKFDYVADAMRIAMHLNDLEVVKDIFFSCTDLVLQKQLAFLLGRQQLWLSMEDHPDEEVLADIISNTHLSQNFLALGRELDIMEPKIPDDIYKTHLEPSRPLGTAPGLDSARMNLAASFVNGFVNAGFGQDKLLLEEAREHKDWLYKNKEHGMMSAAASLGLILLWDVENGLSQIDKYLYSKDDYIKAGALLACGVVNCSVKNDCDPALALLSDYVSHKSVVMRLGATLGLGLAYAGTNREDVLALLLGVLGDSTATMEVLGVASVSCGLISVGSLNEEVITAVLQCLIEKFDTELKSTFTKLLVLGLALTCWGKQDGADTIQLAIDAVSEPTLSLTKMMVDICAYAGTGNVLKIQQLLHVCSEHYEEQEEKKEDKKKEKKSAEKMEIDRTEEGGQSGMVAHQGLAVLGIAVIAMGEEVGSEMAVRAFGHLLRCGESVIRAAVPLSLALISASNPKLPILDTLSKFSHDSDLSVAANAILAMGIVGAGTNNARLAAMLRQLATYHYKDQRLLFMVRFAQGLVHMGKGTQTLSPYHADRQILQPTAASALLVVLISALDVKGILLGNSHYLLYALTPAIRPRMLVTFDEDLNPLPTTVRVGQAVDVVGQAGKPKTITGFQTHTTPVLLAYGERAELATDEYIPLTPVLEGFVILRKNPDHKTD